MREIKENTAIFKEKFEQLECDVKKFMGNAELLTFDGVPLATWRTGKKSRTFRLKKIGGGDDDE